MLVETWRVPWRSARFRLRPPLTRRSLTVAQPWLRRVDGFGLEIHLGAARVRCELPPAGRSHGRLLHAGGALACPRAKLADGHACRTTRRVASASPGCGEPREAGRPDGPYSPAGSGGADQARSEREHGEVRGRPQA